MTKTILMRRGSKNRLASSIVSLFPEHDTYIEPFFGAGAVFFYKPLAKYNFLNDLDNEVYNFWRQVKYNKDNLLREIMHTPIHQNIIKHDTQSDNNLTKACLFFLKSNCTYLSDGATIKVGIENPKIFFLKKVNKVLIKLSNAKITNKDFRNFVKSISFRNLRDKNRSFIYSDPPYWQTDSNYNTPNWTWQDVLDCFDATFEQGIRGSLSEFDSPQILALAKDRGLHVYHLGDRRNIKNRRNEILITNYNYGRTLFSNYQAFGKVHFPKSNIVLGKI